MNQNVIKLMFALIRSVICGERMSEEDRELYSADLLPSLIALSSKHDVAHLAVQGLSKNAFSEEEWRPHFKSVYTAVYRVSRIDHSLGEISKIFENGQIQFIPLKGSVLRRYYPESWMRTSCDIDILVHSEDVDKAAEMLVSTEKYENKGKGTHDISLFSNSGVHIELHYDLVEDDRANNAAKMLREVWEYAHPTDDKVYQYELTDAMFYYYHIAHMAKHLEHGGCGIRPFVDLWILNRLPNVDKDARKALLEQGGLLRFAECTEKLSRVWLDGEASDVVTEQMANYILHGGVYGSADNRVLFQNSKKGGKVKYLLSRIFLPYETIKYQYPKWGKHRQLTPLMNICRWFKLIFCGNLKRVKHEITLNAGVTEDQAEQSKQFLKDIGL